MKKSQGKQSHLWSIILAGGEGKRLGPLTQQWLGYHHPKQYCTFTGTRSMLQHTLDRADRLTAPDQKITVISRARRQEAWPHLAGRLGSVVLQPADRDTAAGIFLPLTYVRAQDPKATVVIYPSDHFVYPEDRFIEVTRHAVQAAEHLNDRLVLLGAQTDSLEMDYGWIHPGQELGRFGDSRVQAVSAFLEKPGYAEAQHALASGAMWNTFVMAARVETLWRLGWFCFPVIMQLFEKLQAAIGTDEEEVLLESLYMAMPIRNFSMDVLQRVPTRVSVIEMTGVDWSDWGKPERIVESLDRIGKQPAFPVEFAEPVGQLTSHPRLFATDPKPNDSVRSISATV
jgi:mannose-1-phosphate guanylyltransferase